MSQPQMRLERDLSQASGQTNVVSSKMLNMISVP